MPGSSTQYQFGDCEVFPETNIIVRGESENPVSPRVMDLLVYLIEHRDRVVPADELLDTFWANRVVEESTIHRHISQIRTALGDSAKTAQYIKTVSKRGYQAVAPVTIKPPANIDANLSEAEHPVSNSPLRRIQLVVATVMLLIAGYWGLQLNPFQPEYSETPPQTRPLESIAVLPFKNLSDRASVGFFAEGLSDGILDELSQIGHMKVASQTTSRQLAEEGLALMGIANRLGVDYVLVGSVQEQAGELRISTQLIRAADGFHVFSKTYERLFKNSFGAQRQISRNISQMSHDKIWLDLRRQHPEQFDELKGIEPEAVALYLQSSDYYNQYVLGEGGELTIAMNLMEKAAQIDPDFMAAHSDLAWNYLKRINPALSLEQSTQLAHSAINRMQSIDPDSSDAAFMLAQVYIELDLDYDSAARLIQQQIERSPTAHWWRSFLADIAAREGRLNASLELMKADASLHPDFSEAEFLPAYAQILVLAGRHTAALEYSERALNLIHRGMPRAIALLIKAKALLALNREPEALDVIEEAWTHASGEILERFAVIFAHTGQIDRARQALASARVRSNNRLYFAQAYEQLGDLDRVLELIHDGILDHDPSIIGTLRANIWSDAVRQDPRFNQMLVLLNSKESLTPAGVSNPAED